AAAAGQALACATALFLTLVASGHLLLAPGGALRWPAWLALAAAAGLTPLWWRTSHTRHIAGTASTP
ncbi:MAG: hypothetical protein Q8L86_20650, partial [Vicinamibacterales bacterium]|nr:hypothetical protein [Vicinamibacterales bacterium]